MLPLQQVKRSCAASPHAQDFVASNPWIGISVGVIAPSSPSPLLFNYGALDHSAPPVTQDTLFSINSMTKVFTALALAESVVAGRVGLNDTVQSHTKHAMPRDGDAEFWLLDLATHWSGLPVRPDNLPNPDYYNYTDDMFFAFMANYSFPELHVRKQYYYSNCAFGLLASVITAMQDQHFRSMCRRLFFSPLSMTLSGLATDPQPAAPYATGHMSNGTALPRGVSDEAVLGSWAIASTARDMLLFLDAHLRYGSGNSSGGLLGDAVRLAQQPVRPTDDPEYGIGLGWRTQLSTNVRLKTGSGDGFESCMMCVMMARRVLAFAAVTREQVQRGACDCIGCAG